MNSFQDVMKIASVVQLRHQNVTIIVTALLREPRHFIKKINTQLSKRNIETRSSQAIHGVKSFQNENFEIPAKVRHLELKYAKSLELPW